MRRLKEKPVTAISERVRDLIAETDPDVLEQALEKFATEKRLQEIEDEINTIGAKRAELSAMATALTHEREELLGEEPSAIAGCVTSLG